MDAWTEEDSNRLTAALVVLDGHRMCLSSSERVQAIGLAVRYGLDRETTARRIGISLRALAKFAERYELQLPPPEEYLGYSKLATSSNRPERRRERYHRTRSAAAVP